MIEMLFPYPPSTNRYWRMFRNRMVRSKQAVEYKEEVGLIAEDAITQQFEGCVRVDIKFHPERPKDWEKRAKKDPQWGLGVRRVDLDNALKVALDAMQGVAYEDDRQITDIRIRLRQPIEGGGMTVSVGLDEFWESPQ